MYTCYFKDLSKYDKRCEPISGTVFVFDNEKEWDAFIANSARATLTNRATLAVIVYGFSDEATNAYSL